MRLVLLLSSLFLFACGSLATSPDVGGYCGNDRDCLSRCTMNETFGTGMCTRRCSNDKDCPEGTACVNREDGICAVSCGTDRDCEDFGRAFVCKNVRRMSGGDTLVCRLP